MEARVVNNLSPAAAHDGAVRCLLAIELSKKSWVVAVNTPLSDKISLYKLKPCDWKELLQLIARIRKRVAQELKKPVEVISCYEAGYDGFWLHRLLEAHGVHNHVIDPASVMAGHHGSSARAFAVNPSRLPARPCGLRGLTAQRGQAKGPTVPSMQNCARPNPLET